MDLTSDYLLENDGKCEDAGKDTAADDDDVLDDDYVWQLIHLQLQVNHAWQDEREKGSSNSTWIHHALYRQY